MIVLEISGSIDAITVNGLRPTSVYIFGLEFNGFYY
jgi:hypothetical protein